MPDKQDDSAFREVYDQYADAIFRHCYLRVLDREMAKDFVQDAFIRYWQYLEAGNRVDNARALLYKIANNLIVDNARRQKRRPTVSLDSLEEVGFQPSHDPLPEWQEQWKSQHVMGMLRDLPPTYRDLLVMRYCDGLQPREIAKATGRSVAVISVQLHRAVRKLRSRLNHGE